MKCKICNTQNESIFSAKILNKYNVKYYSCTECGFLQTEEPYWLDEAYSSSINLSDTGILKRNESVKNILSPLIFFMFNKEKSFLDYAGGFGILTRLMRDEGFDFYTNDPFTPNLVARGFEFDLTNSNNSIELITAIECFEHYANPVNEIDAMLSICKNIYFTTKLIPNPIPSIDEWDYYGLSHGQHVSIYSYKTLKYIANKYKLNLYSIGGSHHLLTTRNFNKYQFYLLVLLGKFKMLRWLNIFMKSKTNTDSKLARLNEKK